MTGETIGHVGECGVDCYILCRVEGCERTYVGELIDDDGTEHGQAAECGLLTVKRQRFKAGMITREQVWDTMPGEEQVCGTHLSVDHWYATGMWDRD